MTAHELVAKIARMRGTTDAEDNALTMARLIDEARKIMDARPRDVKAALVDEARDYVRAGFDIDNLLKRLATALEATEARAVELERENYELRLIITGGEDAPGYAGSFTLSELRDDHARLLREYGDAIDWRERQLAAAREVLRPFARCYEINDCEEHDPREAVEVPIADLRRARAFLSPAPAPVSGEQGTGARIIDGLHEAIANARSEPAPSNMQNPHNAAAQKGQSDD